MRGGRRNSPPNREERFLETETAETLLRAGARAGSLLARFPQNGGFSGRHYLTFAQGNSVLPRERRDDDRRRLRVWIGPHRCQGEGMSDFSQLRFTSITYSGLASILIETKIIACRTLSWMSEFLLLMETDGGPAISCISCSKRTRT